MQNKYPLGAFLNEVDNRDIPYASIVGLSQASPAYIEVPGFLAATRLLQGPLGTCVEHALEFSKRVNDGIVHSRRIPYALTRQVLGLTDFDPQGLAPREAAKTAVTVGMPKDCGVDDNTLPHAVYAGLAITPQMRTDANIYRFGGFSFPTISVQGIKQALANGKTVVVTVAIDWNAIDSDGTVHPAKNIAGYHEVVIGIADDGNARFRFANWWGTWGTQSDGFITYAELEQVVYDNLVFSDIPENLLARANVQQFIFLNDLSVGTNSAANIQLQARLTAYGLFSASPSRNFGPATLQAVISYQRLKGLPQTGYVGPLTRQALNADIGEGLTKSKLDLWIEAAIQMEGANPALNNPGNLRFVGQKDATGQDARGFCIFPDYATGYTNLRNLFIRAASGASTVYHPFNTLYEFYALYAPSADGNAPKHYAEVVAAHLGVDPTVAINTLLS